MGRTVSYRYTVQIDGITPSVWRVRATGQIPGYGTPNAANLQKLVDAYIESQNPGGPNEHLVDENGCKWIPGWARIIDELNNEVVVEMGWS